jgi:hypothetical protein
VVGFIIVALAEFGLLVASALSFRRRGCWWKASSVGLFLVAWIGFSFLAVAQI